MTITFDGPPDASRLEGIDGVRVTATDGPVVHLSAPETAMDTLVKEIARHPVVDLVSQPADLEEIFLERTGRATTAAELYLRGIRDHRRALAAWCVGVVAYIGLIAAIFPSIEGSPSSTTSWRATRRS